MELLTKFQDFHPGDKLTLTVSNWFGNKSEMKVTLVEKPEQHGYLEKSGGWSLYGPHNGSEPCYQITVRPYRCRKKIRLKLDFDIVDVRAGW